MAGHRHFAATSERDLPHGRRVLTAARWGKPVLLVGGGAAIAVGVYGVTYTEVNGRSVDTDVDFC
jgi:hypothetical protein